MTIAGGTMHRAAEITRAEAALTRIIADLGGDEAPVPLVLIGDALMGLAAHDEALVAELNLSPRRSTLLPLLGLLVDRNLVRQSTEGLRLTEPGRQEAATFETVDPQLSKSLAAALED